MKKRFLFIVLIVICFISLSINVIYTINYKHAKKSFLSYTYSHLVSIHIILDDLVHSVSTDDEIMYYNLSSLERECIQLDDSIHGLCALSPNNQAFYKFEDLSKKISNAVTANRISDKIVINDITQYKETIQALIRKLSPKGELNDNGYGGLSTAPNYSLRIKQIINSINDTLKNIP